MLNFAIALGFVSLVGAYASSGTRKKVSVGLTIFAIALAGIDISLRRSDPNKMNTNNSNSLSQDASLLAELKDSCRRSDSPAPCVFIGSTDISDCKVSASSEYTPNASPSPPCAQEVQQLLSAKGVSSTIFTQQLYPEGFNPEYPYNAGCIGWRSDMGATREGALGIQQILGNGYTVGPGCNPSGYSYQVMLKS